jgi:hypothetical protein
MDTTSWIIFIFLIDIWLVLNLNYSIFFKYIINIEKIEHMEYIFNKVIPIDHI